MTFDSDPEHERFDEMVHRQGVYCANVANINEAIEQEFQDWDGDELAIAFRDEDALRVGQIFLRRVWRRLKSNAEVLA